MADNIEILTGDPGVIETARRLLEGNCVAIPTETVYGLAADASNDSAVKAIFEAKGRPSDHPLIVHIASASQLRSWAKCVPAAAWQLAETFWPGPLTILLEKADHVSTVVTGGLSTIALRVPAHPLFRRVLLETSLGLAAPSANRYKKLSPTTAGQVVKGMTGYIDAVLDGGPCEYGLESTIVDLTGDDVTVLRAGPINRGSIEDCLKTPVSLPAQHNIAVPGNVDAHYQPGVPLHLTTIDDLITSSDSQAGFLIWSETAVESMKDKNLDGQEVLRLPDNPVDYGRGLYSALNDLEERGVTKILLEKVPSGEGWNAINDRLNRAAFRTVPG